MVDCAPPEIAGTWLMVHSMIICAARVAMARYRPLIRRDGIPTIVPTSAAIMPPAGTATQNGMSSRVIRLAPA